MHPFRQLARGLRALTHRSATDREITDEVEHYLAQAAAEHERRGVPRREAVRLARLELGNVTTTREQVRGYGWENAVESALADLRYGLRRLRASPGFTAITALTLALGVGATTAIASAVSVILFEPLPYPQPGRIAAIEEIGSDGSRNAGTFGMYRELSERSRSFEAIAVAKAWQPTLTGADQPERLEGQRVSASYFTVVGVSPTAGRDFQQPDDRLNGPNVVIISEGLWRRRFSADRAIVGRQVVLDDDSYLVVGIMPKDYENVLAPAAELWAPLQYDMSQGRAWGHHLRTVGRLRPGVGIDQATRELNALGRTVLREQRPETYDPNTRFGATSLQDVLTRGVRPALLAILGAVALVLVIACVNVTNLLLARGAQRRSEFALRAALGAGQRRLIRQLLTESLTLAVLGGVLGVVVAMLGVRALGALSPPELPRAGAIALHRTVFGIAVGITTLIGLACGMIPALQAAHSDPYQDLQAGTRRTVGGHRRVRSGLVVAEVAIALVLLVSSGLLLRSIERLFAVDPGFDPEHMLTMQVQTSGHRFRADSVKWQFFTQAIEAVRQAPGVTAVAVTSQLPMSGDLDEYGARFEPTATQPERTYSTFRYAVSPGYIETMRIPLRRGRLLDERDRGGAPPVAVISESLAKLAFPGADPIGQRMRVGGPNDSPPYTIVGVVGDIKQMSFALNQSEAVYTPSVQWHWADDVMSLVVRTRGDPAALGPAIREAVWSVDKDQPIVRVATMDALFAASAASRRFALTLFESFGLAALVLAAAGVYGILAGSVVERWREIGVRSALGASRRDIMGLVLGQGLRLTTVGVIFGIGVALLATRMLATLLFGISHVDPLTYVGVVALLVVTAVVASALPAWRASRVDPVTALRSE